MAAVFSLVTLFFTAAVGPARGDEPKQGPGISLPPVVDIAGKEHPLARGAAALPVVFAWTARDCPMAKVYAPRLKALASELVPRGVQFFLVDSSSDATPEALRDLVQDGLPTIADAHGEMARLLGARSTTGSRTPVR